MVRITILGKGAREKVIKEKLYHHEVTIIDDISLISNDCDLIIPSMEKDLVDGIVDKAKIPCFGPSLLAAQIEGSKIFSKHFMKKHKINTSEYIAFDLYHDLQGAKKYIRERFDVIKQVIKLDGLASGKGVFVPETLEEAYEILKNIGDQKIIIEDRIYGTEVSVMGFCNGKEIELMPQIVDYKRIYDGDIGPNTGGMGAIGPVDILSKEEMEEIKTHMLKVVGNLNFKGVLYAGIIKGENKYYFLEFNCRFGDPETQIALNLLDSDLYTIMIDCIEGNKLNIKWKQNIFGANVVLSHEDYPFSKSKDKIKIEVGDLDSDILVYWANKDIDNYTNGGRVASVVSLSNNLFQSINNVYNNIYKIKYQGRYFRYDIGYKYLKDQGSSQKRLKLAVLSSGRGTSLTKLLDNNLIELIVSDKNNGVLDRGMRYGVKTLFLPRINFERLIDILDSFKIDIIFLVGYSRIVPSFFCRYYKDRMFNIHPSLLPNYKCMYSIKIHQQVIKDKQRFSGCTLHQVTPNVDDGRIMLQKQMVLGTSDPYELRGQIQELEKEILYDFYFMIHNFNMVYSVDVKGSEMLIEDFCSINQIGDILITSATDGVGTKIELAKEHEYYDGIGIDLVAMSVNDMVVRGSKPILFLDYLAMNKLDAPVFRNIISSIKQGCKLADIKLVGGETAEMGSMYKYKSFDLAGFCVGSIGNNILPQIDRVKRGCKIYGLKSNGVHSNGFSLIRKILKIHDHNPHTFLKPTKIYMECLGMIERYGDKLLGMAHITGGGLSGNIKRIIPSDLKIKIDIEIKDEFLWLMEKGKLSYNQMLETFNCGYGIALIFEEGFDIELDQIGTIF